MSTKACGATRVRERLPGLQARTLARRAIPIPASLPLAEAIRRADAAQARALAFREVCARFASFSDDTLAKAAQRFGVVAPFGGPTVSGLVTLHCPPDQVYALTDFLREQGAEAVAVADLDYVFSRDNPLFAKLAAGL